MPDATHKARPAFIIRFALLLLFLLSGHARAHEGHDHGVESAMLRTTQSEPRIEATSANATLVGILKAGRLWLYVDRTDSNEPIVDATIELEVNGVNYRASPQSNGVYSVAPPWAKQSGQYNITFTLHGKNFDDLLIGRLDVPSANAGQTRPAALPMFSWSFYALAAGAGLYLIVLWTKRRTATADPRGISATSLLQMALIITLALTTAAAMDKKPAPQVAAALTATSEDITQQSQRLPDGSVAIPKPAQRVLTIRTATAHVEPVTRTYILNGRVVQNPYTNAAVQAEQTGRLEPPPQGFPSLGARVKKGQLLAYLLPTMTPLELARRDSDLRALERDRYLTKRAYERVKTQMGTTDVSASVMLETNRAQLLAFNQQIRALTDIPVQKLPVTAPIDGIIGASSASTARIVRPGDDLFRIWDPKANWVEAINFEPGLETRIASAMAVLSDGRNIPLSYTGQGYLLRNQGVPLQFSPGAAADAFLVGQLVKVYIRSNEPLQGVRVPHDSVISRADGDPFVWVQEGPEHFERRTVSVTPLDNTSDIVTAGLTSDEHVVVAGASLISRVQ